MRVIAPVTDYIKGSLLTTIGDLVSGDPVDHDRIAAGALDTYLKAQGVGVKSVYEQLALSDTGVFIGNTMRNSAGPQIITGIGFQPSVIIIFACDGTSTNQNHSWGFGNIANSFCIYLADDASLSNPQSTIVYIRRDGSNRITGVISAFGVDGFTITWTLLGTCSCDYVYLCLP